MKAGESLPMAKAYLKQIAGGSDANRPRSLEDELVLRHFARYRWLYLTISVALTTLAYAGAPLFPHAYYPLPALVLIFFVLPLVRRPRVSALQRFVQYFVVTLFALATVSQTLLGFLDIFDRTTQDRLARLPFRLQVSHDQITTGAFHWWTLALSLVLSMLLLRVRSVPLSRIRIAFWSLSLGCACAAITIPSAIVLWQHNSGDLLAAFGPSTIGAFLSLALLAWSLAAVSILAKKTSPSLEIAAEIEDNPANEYVKAASTVATTALLIAFFGLNTCWGYIGNLSRFIYVREAVAADYIAWAIEHDPAFKPTLLARQRSFVTGRDGRQYLSPQDLNADAEVLQKHPPQMAFIPKAVWLENFSIVSMEDHDDTFLASYPRVIMFNVQVK